VNERKRVTPHTPRHVFASELLHAGANLRQIQELLGHKHLDSIQRYTRVNAHELRGAIKRLRWVGDRPLRSAPLSRESRDEAPVARLSNGDGPSAIKAFIDELSDADARRGDEGFAGDGAHSTLSSGEIYEVRADGDRQTFRILFAPQLLHAPDALMPEHIARWRRGSWGEQNTAKAPRRAAELDRAVLRLQTR
jgi:hypothetical protein